MRSVAVNTADRLKNLRPDKCPQEVLGRTDLTTAGLSSLGEIKPNLHGLQRGWQRGSGGHVGRCFSLAKEPKRNGVGSGEKVSVLGM